MLFDKIISIFLIFNTFMSESKDEWRLKSISMQFEKGWDHYAENDPRSCDRYEGQIVFGNDEGESFQFNIDQEMSEKYIKLISEQVVESAGMLGERVAASLGLNKKTLTFEESAANVFHDGFAASMLSLNSSTSQLNPDGLPKTPSDGSTSKGKGQS